MATNTPVIDATGCTSLRTAEWRENMVDDIEASSEFGSDAQTGSDKLLGQLLDIHAARLGELSEYGQAIYDAGDPDSAEGVLLDNRGATVGVAREPATYSSVTVTLGGTAATVIDTTKRMRVPGSAYYWTLTADATIGYGGTVDATAKCTTTGPVEAAAGALTEIVDSVTGWDTVTNAADATVGEDVETDAAYRLRIEESLSAGGTSTDHALRVALEALADVTDASVISNRTMATDGDGIPAKSFLAVLWPATGLDEEAVAEVIWDHCPTGIYSHGVDKEASVVDSQGYTQMVRWSYATAVEIYWEITVTKNADYPADGDTLVSDAVVAYGATLSVGDDVLPMGAVTMILDSTQNDYYVPGIDHLVVEVGLTASPTGTVPVAIAATEISAHDAARITVTS